MTDTSRVFPVAKMVLREPVVALPSLVMITADAQVLEGLGGVHAQKRLGQHIRLLAKHVINQAHGIDDGSLLRAIRAHTGQDIFGRFPEAAVGVFDALGCTSVAYTWRGGQLTSEDYAELGDFLNHLAGLHGLEESLTTTERAIRLGRRATSLVASGTMPASAGPEIFWDVVLEPETLELFGLPGNTATVQAAISLIRAGISFAEISEPYAIEGERRLALMQ